jgi:succinyl-CoA synthetase alpha subunit
MKEAFDKHPEVTVMVNFASFRSVYSSVLETLEFSDTIKTIAIIAEGVPESQTRALNKMAQDKGVGIIGPATVGGIKVRSTRFSLFSVWPLTLMYLTNFFNSCLAGMLSDWQYWRYAGQYCHV